MARSKRKTSAGGSFGRRVRGLGEAPEPARRRWPITLAVIGIVFVAFFVRFYGLSHDLDEDKVYHPDTRKQIDAARDHFVKGRYYFHTDQRGIDGYPYFNMHVVEWEWRGIAGAHSFLTFLMGWNREVLTPYEHPGLRLTLYVITRLSICLMSAALVLIIYVVGRETWGVTVGLVAAGLLALSPLNVGIAHFAMSDSVMDFFAGLAILFVMRMYRGQRAVNPLLAAFFGVLAFASKYNGGIVLVFVALLHVLKFSSVRRLFGKDALRNVGLLVVGGVIGLIVGFPSLLIYPDRVIKETVEFFRYVSNFGLTPAETTLTGWARFSLYGPDNLATLLRSVGPIVMIAAVGGFALSIFRKRRHVLIGLFPLLYLAISLLGKPAFQPYFFSVLLPYFCLYAAVVAGWLGGLKKVRVPGTVAAVILVGAAVITYAVRVVRIDFFFWHMDTRRMATAWVDENVPTVFDVASRDYGLYGWKGRPGPTVETVAIATGNLHKTRPPERTFRLQRFHLEETRPLSVFRNSSVTLSGFEESEHLKPGFSMPVYQRVPSKTGNEFIFPLGAEFLRSGRFMALYPRATRRIYVIPDRFDGVVVALRNGDVANVVALSFGGRRQEIALEPLETHVLTIAGPKRMPLIGGPFFKFWARATSACQVEVAVSDEQKGVLYYKAAQYANALPHLAAAWRERPGPVLAQMTVVAAACSGKDPDELEDGAIAAAARRDLDHVEDSLVARFGISALYVENLPYVEREVEDFSDERIARIIKDASASADTCVMPAPNGEGEWSVKLGTLFLEPGWYRVTLSARADEGVPEAAALTVSFLDVTGEIVHASATRPVDGLVGPDYRDVECWLQVADRLGPVTLEIATAPDVPLRLDRLTIRPDLVRQIESRDRLARAILDGTLAELRAEPQHLDALLACGDEAARSGEAVLALAAYEKAAEADPDSHRPYARLRGILDELPAELKAAAAAKLDQADALHALPARRKVRIRFKSGLVVTGYRLGADKYAPGETLELTLYWRVRPEDARRYLEHALFIQFIPEGGKKEDAAFQGDTDLASSLRFNERLDRLRPIFRHPIKIPDDVPPGKYEIEIGLEIRPHRKRIRVLEADVPHTNNSATLGTVEVVRREESAPD